MLEWNVEIKKICQLNNKGKEIEEMKKAILLIGILLTILFCSQYLFKEGFASDDKLTFLGINYKGLHMMGPGPKNSFKHIYTPEISLKQVVYDKGTVAILSYTNKVYVCKNCPLHLGDRPVWKEITVPTKISTPGPTGTPQEVRVGSLKKIALDDNHVFVLDVNGLVLVCKECNMNNPRFEILSLPMSGSVRFRDFSARGSNMVGIEGKTNKIWSDRDYDFSGIRWENIPLKDVDANNKNDLDFSQIAAGTSGYQGLTSGKKVYYCDYPCDGTTTKWRNLGKDGSTQIGYADNYLASKTATSLNYCQYPCTSSSNWKNKNLYGLRNGEVFSYYYPPVEAKPTVDPIKPIPPALTQAMLEVNRNTATLNKIKRLTRESKRMTQLLKNSTRRNNLHFNKIRAKSKEEADKLVKQLKLSKQINEEFLTDLVNGPRNAVVTLDQPLTTLLTGKKV